MKNFLFLLLSSLPFQQSSSQNVGIGTAAPSAPVHIKSSTAVEMLRIEGNNPYISFFDNTQGYRGYLWYNSNRMEMGTPVGSGLPVVIAPGLGAAGYFTTAGRLGLGISNPAERLDVNGNINLTGLLKVNGSNGTAGQVLTSNGTSDPQWKNAAYGNNTRFAVSFEENSGTSNGNARITLTRYNLNTSNVIIGASNITINQSGLYHFDLEVNADMFFSSAQSIYPEFGCWLFTGAPNSYPIVDNRIMTATSDSKIGWRVNEKASLEVYVTAPATISIYHTYGFGGGSSYNIKGYLTGHLISE